MYSSSESKNDATFKSELRSEKRQRQALREFKDVLADLVFMFRQASGVKTVYMYWVNRGRRQFVMETKATTVDEVVFQDRVSFDEHFLDSYKDIRSPVALHLDEDISPQVLNHYNGTVPVEHITLLPFVNNGETVAMTVVEANDSNGGEMQQQINQSFLNALGNVLSTYLELNDLYEDQQEWVDYEESLDFLDDKGHFSGLIESMLSTMQRHLKQGGVSFVSRGIDGWYNVMGATEAHKPVAVGMKVEDQSLTRRTLNSGEPEFVIHFNRNPKRISPREVYSDGATLAIPLMFGDRRQGVALVHDQSPLVFKEATKHKFINLVRLTSLKIQAKISKEVSARGLLANDYGAFIPDVWQRVINTQIERLKRDNDLYHSWVGMVTLSELSQIRTQCRLEELNQMQQDFVRVLNPSRYAIPGLVGFHADYVYLIFLQSKDEHAAKHWQQEVTKTFSQPIRLTNGKHLETGLKMNITPLDGSEEDAYEIVSKLKPLSVISE